MSTTEKRLAELEKGLKAAEQRAKAAEDRAAAAEAMVERTELERKRTAAQLHDVKVQATAEVRRLQSMRDLDGPGSPYAQDSRERYEMLKRSTVKTKDGRRHYYAEAPCYISDNGKPPFVYHPRDSFVSLPEDADPSVTWKAVKVGGKDPKSGSLVFVPLETELDEGKEVDPRQEVAEDPGSEQFSNTDVNEKASSKRAKNAQLGAGSSAKPTRPERPGAQEPDTDAKKSADDDTAEGEGARPSDTDVG